MNERFTKIQHKGIEVHYFDYRGLSSIKEDEFINTIHEATEVFLGWGTDQLALVDMREAYTSSNIMKVWREASKTSSPLIKRSAILGISGSKAILLKGINLFSKLDVKPFNTKEEALDWLVKD